MLVLVSEASLNFSFDCEMDAIPELTYNEKLTSITGGFVTVVCGSVFSVSNQCSLWKLQNTKPTSHFSHYIHFIFNSNHNN